MSEQQRQLPYDIDVEQALLGSLMVDATAFARLGDALCPHHFFDPLHQRMFNVMLRKYSREIAVTPLTLHSAMAMDEGLNEVGGLAYLTSLARAAPAIPNVKDYGVILRELAVRRDLIKIGEDLVNGAYEAPLDLPSEDLANGASQALYDATRLIGADQSEPRALDDFVDEALKDSERATQNPGDAYITTGFKTVDDELGPLFRKDVTVLGGATSMAKTAFAQATFMANGRMGKVGLFFSLEMPGAQLATRYLAQGASVSSDRIRRGTVTDNQFARVVDAGGNLRGLPLYIDETPGLSVAQIFARCQAIKRRHGKLDLVALDHLQFVAQADPRATVNDGLRQIMKDMKAVAKSLDCAFLVLCHLNNEQDRRTNKRPQLGDLYGSSGIRQDADTVMFIHREEYYLEREKPDLSRGQKAHDDWLRSTEEQRGKAEVFTAKVRMGKIGSAVLYFDAPYTRFRETADDAPPSAQMDFSALAER